MERRTFLCTAASALAAASAPSLLCAQDGPIRQRMQQTRDRIMQGRDGERDSASQRREARQNRRRNATTTRVPIALQLYSVRGAASRDLAGTLEGIAKLGYDGVEFAGYYGKEIKDIRKMLDDNGLKCAGTHTGIGELRNNLERTIEIHQILGGKYIIVPGGIDAYLHDAERNKRMAEEFNQYIEKTKPCGLYVGYHAHGGDARLVEGTPAWERLFDAARPELVHQMDIGNYMEGGGDPYKMIEKFKGQSKTIHLKETGQGRPIIGDGIVDWEKAFDLSETVGGVEWYIVEDEVGPDNLDRVEKCIIALRGMGK